MLHTLVNHSAGSHHRHVAGQRVQAAKAYGWQSEPRQQATSYALKLSEMKSMPLLNSGSALDIPNCNFTSKCGKPESNKIE
jgi:hypothetical protein